MSREKAAADFATYWQNKGYEKGESQAFWLSLLKDVFDVDHPEQMIRFEDKVVLDHTSFIDGYIDSTKVMIEQKSAGKNLRSAIRQSDGTLLTPFQQAKRYITELPVSKHPRYVVTCNFNTFLVYDMENPAGDPEEIALKDLKKDYYRLSFLIDEENPHIKKETDLSVKAGDIVGLIYDALYERYKDPESEESLKSLNMLCVRLVFCLYAEDADIFGHHGMFHDYLMRFDARDLRRALIDLFKVLDTKTEDRDPYLDEALSAFPYVNGGLFKEEDIEIPQFTEEIKTLLLTKASDEFDWSEISPTIFGAVFESTLNQDTRRKGGMHYTSIEKIHKVIDPLFLDDLKEELRQIKEVPTEKTRNQKLKAYKSKLASLKFLDPACGSGNFLTETYTSLRRLENEVIAALSHGQMAFTDDPSGIIEVSISQFYGIEINDFAVTVAKTALWIAESQMIKETEEILLTQIDFLPLKTNANITEGNALTLNWEDIVNKGDMNYIMGNPPFIGASLMNSTQKEENTSVIGKKKKLVNSIDYVGGWYYKVARLIKGTEIRAALVSTNSITQGEQVAPLWEELIDKYGLQIIFAHKTFRWDSEANIKAHVHCVIIGMVSGEYNKDRYIYDRSSKGRRADNINPYLLDAPNILITSRSKPICKVPVLTKGNQPTDGGNLILSEEEREKLIKDDPSIKDLVRRYIGGKDFLNNNEIRYCLWLKDVPPDRYAGNREIMRRLENVKAFREKSTAEPTRKAALTPFKFFSSPQNDKPYLIIPRVSSEKREYIPIGYMEPQNIASDSCSIVLDGKIYHFGVLSSIVHMAWVQVVCGRLEMRYRYSGSIVYNNFPWPDITKEQERAIEDTAKMILDARNKYPDSSLATLYNPLTMPPDLRKAHQMNDRAVMEAYGFKKGSEEYRSKTACVAALMRMYKELTEKEALS